MKFISSNGIDFVVGETITGESKVDVMEMLLPLKRLFKLLVKLLLFQSQYGQNLELK